MTTRLRPTTS
jgi:hypothetical protein